VDHRKPPGRLDWDTSAITCPRSAALFQLPLPIHTGTAGIAVGVLCYAVSTTTAVLVALLASSPGRRRDARKVLALLLRRPDDDKE
jgi:hypothetical protein